MKLEYLKGADQNTRSPPARGAWIEIPGAASAYYPANVAPREGGVD